MFLYLCVEQLFRQALDNIVALSPAQSSSLIVLQTLKIITCKISKPEPKYRIRDTETSGVRTKVIGFDGTLEYLKLFDFKLDITKRILECRKHPTKKILHYCVEIIPARIKAIYKDIKAKSPTTGGNNNNSNNGINNNGNVLTTAKRISLQLSATDQIENASAVPSPYEMQQQMRASGHGFGTGNMSNNSYTSEMGIVGTDGDSKMSGHANGYHSGYGGYFSTANGSHRNSNHGGDGYGNYGAPSCNCGTTIHHPHQTSGSYNNANSNRNNGNCLNGNGTPTGHNLNGYENGNNGIESDEHLAMDSGEFTISQIIIALIIHGGIERNNEMIKDDFKYNNSIDNNNNNNNGGGSVLAIGDLKLDVNGTLPLTKENKKLIEKHSMNYLVLGSADSSNYNSNNDASSIANNRNHDHSLLFMKDKRNSGKDKDKDNKHKDKAKESNLIYSL